MKPPRPTTTEIAERVVMPLLFAFALGVLITLEVVGSREREALETADRAVALAAQYADVCELAWPPADAPELTALVTAWEARP